MNKTVVLAMVAVMLIVSVCVGCTFTGTNAAPLSAEKALEQLAASVTHLDGQVSFQIPEGYKKPEEWNIHVAGRQKFEDGFSRSVHLMEDVNYAKAWEPGKQYAIDINDSYTELMLTAFLPDENGETLEKSVDLLDPSASQAFPAVNMVFSSGSTDLEQIGRDAAAFYYSQFMQDDVPQYWHITKYEILSCELMAGDEVEFAVWITSYIETDGYGFLVGQGISNDPDDPIKDGICPEVGRQLRIKALDAGKYEIVSIGTGGGDQGLTPYASQQTTLEPIAPGWSQEQSIDIVGMAELDYASDDIVIFHGYFGLFVYDLDSQQIIRSLDLKPLNCAAIQGDDYCDVTVSADGNTVQLHRMSSENMYVYNVSDNTLRETTYEHMSDRFGSNFIPIEDAVDSEHLGNYSCNAVRFQTGEYGYLHIYDWTLGTLSYVRGDMMYRLFGFNASPSAASELGELLINADVDKDGQAESIYLDQSQLDNRYVTLRIYDGSGKEIWSEDASTSHAGWTSLFLCEQDGEYYLLRYHPTMYQGYCSYVYTLFTLEGGAEKVYQTNALEFNINGTKALDAPQMVAFADEVNALLAKSTLLLSSDGGEYSFGPTSTDQFFERYSWLDETPELYADGDNLETRLVKYSEYAVSNHR